TIHLATAHDGLALRPLFEPVFARIQKGAFGRQLEGADLEALTASGRRFFARGAGTLAEFRGALGDEWSAYPSPALGYSVSYRVPLVQVPPRGLWTTSGQARWTTTEAWLGQSMQDDYPLDRLVLRYLAAFGPATAMDVQAWCGLTKRER
ncbi:MAG: winged helix DNA-binding domain-containing protein, partial [Chloroflexota bacterium]|nr:winged helix DNA-binding domain-containing protein [Chloroflexota bacterium]